MSHKINLAIIGDGCVGKTSYLKRLTTDGELEQRYISTLGVDLIPLSFETNNGKLVFDIWDTAGQEKFLGLRDAYYAHTECAIIMFDVTLMSSFNNVQMWLNDIHRIQPDIPIVLVGNKVESRNREVTPMMIRRLISRCKNEHQALQYFDISSKTKYNFEKPFLFLAQTILNRNDLRFVEKKNDQQPNE